MSDDGVIGFGSTLSVNNGTATTTIGQIDSLDMPSIEVGEADISTMDSTERWQSFVAGLKNAGEIGGSVVFKGSEMTALMALVGAANGTWKLQINDAATISSGSQFQCAGFLKSLGGAVPRGDKVTATFKVKLSGKPSFTAKS